MQFFGGFHHRHALARQGGLINAQIFCLYEPGVRRNIASRSQHEQIAGHDLLGIDGSDDSAADNY